MRVCTWCAAGVRRKPAETSHRNRTPFTPFTGASRNGESVGETALTSTVIGLTAQFVAFLYDLVTQSDSNLSEKILFSGFFGLLVGMCAFLLLRFYDYERSLRCVRCGLNVH